MSISKLARLARGAVLGTAVFWFTSLVASEDFFFGAWNPYNYGTNTLNLDWYDSAGFNAYVGLVSPPGSPETGINLYANRGWRVWGSNTIAHAANDYGHIWLAGREANLIHWEAEDTGSIKLIYPPTTCLIRQGSIDGQFWYVDPDNPNHVQGVPAWELRQHYQALHHRYTAVFYMKCVYRSNLNADFTSI